MKRARALYPALFLACAHSLALPPGAARGGEPLIIQVRGRSQLHLREEERAPTSPGFFRLSVQLELQDGPLPAPSPDAVGAAGAAAEDRQDDPARSFAGQPVTLVLSGPQGPISTLTTTTGSDGRKAVSLGELAAGRYTLLARYAGDAERDPAEVSLIIDLGRLPALLFLDAPTQLAHTGELAMRIGLQSEQKPLSGTVELVVGEWHQLVTVRRGFAEARLPLLGRPWARKGHTLAVVASYKGDALHGSALQRRDVLLTSRARLTLEPAGHGATGAPLEAAQGSALTVSGRASDDDGPLADEPVDIEISEQPGGERAEAEAGPQPAVVSPPPPQASEAPRRSGRLLASGLTDQDGRFRITIPRLPLRPGPAVLGAEVTPRRRYILPGRAAELPLTVLPPEPVSALYYLLPLLGSAALGLLWALGRWLQPLARRLLAAWRARRPQRPAAEAATVGQSSSSVEPITGEPGVRLTPSRRLTGLTLRRTVDSTLDGQVIDASFGRPVSGAMLAVQPAGAEGEAPTAATTSDDGRFTLVPPAAGRYQIMVQAPGYLPQRFDATVPHRGELRGITVALEPLRVRLLEQWRRVAHQLLGSQARLHTATPRELFTQFQRLRAKNPGAIELQQLTDLVEQAYYSPRVCTPEMLQQATRLAETLVSSRSSASLPPTSPSRPPPGPPVPLS